MCVLKQNEECPALGTSICPRRERDSNYPTTQEGVVFQVLQALQMWNGGFCKLSSLSKPQYSTHSRSKAFGKHCRAIQAGASQCCERNLPEERQHYPTPGWAETRQELRQKPCETLHRMWGGDAGGLNAWSCLGHMCPAPPSSSDLAANIYGFLSNTNPPPVPLGCSLGVTQSSRNTYFFLSRISAILSEYNLPGPMLNQGNTFPIFNSVCSTPILLQSFWNPNRRNRRELLHSWFPYI